MKKLFFVLILSFIGMTTYSQNPSIVINQGPSETVSCGPNTCFLADPEPVDYTYSAFVNSDGRFTIQNGWTRSFPTWTPTSGAYAALSASNSLDRRLMWNNTPNSPARTIKVTFTYTKGDSTKTFSAENVVIVRHIGPITSMTIPGASPSNPSSGGTASVPCGASGFTISVPTPTTDPSAGITYTWSLPANWTGSSTSNSISVTPNDGGGGTISVSAQRTDGNVARVYSVNVTRPAVESAIISSISWSPDDKPLCTGETR